MGAFFRSFVGFLICLFCLSCGGKSKSYDYSIGLDPSWYTLEMPGREFNITTFTLELVEAIGKEEKVSIAVYERSWSNLMYGLQKGDYDAMCSTMQPYLFYDKLYDFSDLYLMTGPVLVVPQNSPARSLEQLSGKIVGIQRDSNAALILEKYPDIIQQTYDSIQQAFIDTAQGLIDGAVADILTADAFTKDLYQGQLKIVTPPLTQEGIRILAMKGKAPELIKIFDRGLARLKKNGTYSALLKKWDLAESI